ncbi:hypothetical protein ABB30_01320 [Stenotrophomonas ginsengisoli]|uniref:Uncharacterized protein n=1 Tax=Stenotrophomonas ginsengisoli TaxID=336566 RepID=A0A0R0DC63_9GAMM|nr:hypothetical protein ABB30_01320 [Stenotrophomonas ginsengisoli]
MTLALSISLAGLVACSHDPATTAAPEKSTSNGTRQAPRDAPTALLAVLGLIQDSQQLSDLSVEHVGRHMGQTLQQATDGSPRYGFGVRLDDSWNYGVLLDTQQKPRFELSFNPSDEAASMQPLCQLDYAAFAARLQGLGLQRSAVLGEHGRLQHETFSKPGLQVSVYPQGESAGNAQHLCVRMVSIP